MVAWVKTPSGRAVAHRAPFRPTFHVAGPRAQLDALAASLPLLPGVVEVGFESRLLGLAERRRRALKVVASDIRALQRVAQTVDARGSHHDLDLYDVDLRVSQRFLLERGLFPFAQVEGDSVATLRTDDDAWTIDYATPDLSSVRLDVELRDRRPAARPEDGVAAVVVDGTRFDGAEEDVLRDARAHLLALDPDVVYTRGGDRWMLAHLEARAQALGLHGWTLGRDGARPPQRRGRSFHQYGHVRYSAPTHPVSGRIHVDLDASFFFGETDLHGVVDLSRLAGVPLAELARLEAGTAVTAIQIGQAKREGRLIPWKKNLPEKPKTLRALVKADRGGHIFDPAVGLYDDVIELDFASLYPSLISRHNLGSETILCSCCEDAPPEARVPQVGYHVCRRRRGLVPAVLERLVDRRARYKAMRRTQPERRKEFQGRIDALKWLSVVSFGYQGYKNARFGCIEAHEATCAWAREVLLEAAEVARDHGYEFIHGIVDSLWLRRVSATPGTAEDVAAAVQRVTGVPFEPQGRYKWIVFLPTRAHVAPGAPRIGAPNRFYGCFDRAPDAPSRSQAGQEPDYLADGALKVRGVEMRQSSAPQVVVEAQENALRVLARADDAAAFRAAVPHALDAARPVLRRLRDGACRADELVLTMRVTSGLEGRTQMNHTHAALRQLKRRGVDVPPGDSVRFVVLDAASRDPETRVREARLLDGREGYDARAYEALVVRALASLLLPLGYDEARVAEELADGPRQTRLARWLNRSPPGSVPCAAPAAPRPRAA